MRTLFTILLFPTLVFSQHPFISTGVQGNFNMGYTTPLPFLGGGVEISTPHNYLVGEYTYEFLAIKYGTSAGHQNDASLYGYEKVRGPFLAGVGVGYCRVSTDVWTKSSVHPSPSVLIRTRRYRVFGSYTLKGTDDSNGVAGPGARVEIPMGRATPYFVAALYNYRPTFGNTRMWGGGTVVGLRVRIR